MVMELRYLVQNQINLVVTKMRFLKDPLHLLECLLKSDFVVLVDAFLLAWSKVALRLKVDNSLLPQWLLELKLPRQSVFARVVPFGFRVEARVKVLSIDACLDVFEHATLLVVVGLKVIIV